MREIISHSLQLLLDEMGIDEKRQFMLLVFAGLAALVVYSVRDRHQHGLLFTFLFSILGLSALVFLFTDSEAARDWSALTSILSIVAILTWEFVRRRRAAAAVAAASGDDTPAETSSAAGQP
jgi:hypothetical protein